MATTQQNIQIYRGDYAEIPITVYDNSGNTINISGTTLTYVIYELGTGTILVTKTTDSGIELTSPTVGQAKVILNPIDTTSLVFGWYKHECELLDTNSHPTTILTGYVEVLRSKAESS